MPSTLLDLPNETLTAVLALLGPSTLASLMRVCSRLRDMSERPLYADVAIVESIDIHPDEPLLPRRTVACCKAVAAKPYLAQCIRRFHLRWRRERPPSSEHLHLRRSIVDDVNALLREAHNLEVLELHLAGLMPSFDYGILFAGTAFRLQRLALSGGRDAVVTSVVKSQPSVTYLHLPDQQHSISPSASDVPALETFRGDVDCAASLVPRRPVSTLILRGNDISEATLLKLARGSKPVKYLDLSAFSVTPTQLLTISKHLTALGTLRMRLALRHTLHFTFSGMMLLSALTQVLGAFTQLENLDLSPTSVDGVITGHNEREEQALCVAWSGVSPSLRSVKFPSNTEWERADADCAWRKLSLTQPRANSPGI